MWLREPSHISRSYHMPHVTGITPHMIQNRSHHRATTELLSLLLALRRPRRPNWSPSDAVFGWWPHLLISLLTAFPGYLHWASWGGNGCFGRGRNQRLLDWSLFSPILAQSLFLPKSEKVEFSTKKPSVGKSTVKHCEKFDEMYLIEWDYEKLDEVYLIYKSGIMPED